MQKVTWKFKQYKADPTKAWNEVMNLEEVTPENIVSLAKDEKSVIHNDFEWNDTVAGAKYRLLQAREMIRNFAFVTVEEEKPPVRAFQITTTTNVYKPVEFFLKNEDEYQSLLKRALAELQAFRARYSSLVELDGVFEEIGKL